MLSEGRPYTAAHTCKISPVAACMLWPCSGDPEAIHLTPEQRRKLKRRIANRESARRVRQKKLLSLDELQSKVLSASLLSQCAILLWTL